MRKVAVTLALTVLVLLVGLAVVRANDGHQIPPANGLTPEERLGVQGEHHRGERDLGSVAGRTLVLNDVVIGIDRIAVRFHATGIQAIQFGQIKDNPLYAKDEPTLIIATADGKRLIPFSSSVSKESGTTKTVRGEMVFRWQGGPVHHLLISISRIMGDLQAVWTTSLDM